VLNRLHVLNRVPCPPRPAAAIPTRDHCSHEIASAKTDPEDGGDAQKRATSSVLIMAAHSSLAASQPVGSRPRVVGGHRRLIRGLLRRPALDVHVPP
jgi:hypothetical protein